MPLFAPTPAPQPLRLVRPDPSLAQRGLRCLLDGPERTPSMPRSAATEEQAASFLAYAQTIKLDLSRMVVALQNDCVVAMALWVPSPGHTAVLFVPPLKDHPAILPATQSAAAAALADAAAAGIVLAQVMAETNDSLTPAACAHLNFLRLAQLIYMGRRPPLTPPNIQLPPQIRLEPYSPATHDAFAAAILASYQQTLDCPALSGLRDIHDVLAGHQGVGDFDPNLWSVALRGTTPVGCLLLAEIPARAALEVVYLGLAPAVRGQGLARAFMQRTLAIACRRNFEIMTLAVDAANIPAIKLYKRFGYSQTAQRIAWIKKLP